MDDEKGIREKARKRRETLHRKGQQHYDETGLKNLIITEDDITGKFFVSIYPRDWRPDLADLMNNRIALSARQRKKRGSCPEGITRPMERRQRARGQPKVTRTKQDETFPIRIPTPEQGPEVSEDVGSSRLSTPFDFDEKTTQMRPDVGPKSCDGTRETWSFFRRIWNPSSPNRVKLQNLLDHPPVK